MEPRKLNCNYALFSFLPIHRLFVWVEGPDTHINRTTTQLGDGDKWSKIVYGEEKNCCTEPTRVAKTGKIYCARHNEPNEQTKEEPLSYVLLESPHCEEPIPKIRNKYSQKRNCAVTVLISMHIHVSVSDFYTVFPQLICLFCCRKYVGRSWEYINRSRTQTHECGNWDWGPRNFRKRNTSMEFSLQCICLSFNSQQRPPLSSLSEKTPDIG